MTAEIAIVNRSSVTLAADSAMTMTVGGSRKIYTSTDKIFELSEKDAIGLMVYNNLEFLGAPVEVLIKQFRASDHCCRFLNLEDSAKAFFNFLSTEWMATDDLQYRHVRDILTPLYEDVFGEVWKEIAPFNRSKESKTKPVDILLSCVGEAVEQLATLPVADCFRDVDEEFLIARYGSVLDGLVRDVFMSPPLDEDGIALCRRLGALALQREWFSDLMSGFVFAGFGKSETFPSLFHYESDGIIAGRLKTRLSEKIKTSRDEIFAKVLPFAQRDVVDRFLAGIDPKLQQGLSGYFALLREKASSTVFSGVKGIPRKAKEAVLENLDASIGELVEKFPKWLDEIKKAYSKETEDMILFMAKPEAAHLAESLVNITSLKRKYSAGEESVAGPIDVAVISKSDGFVWVKRKHYFPPELNQRFFVRKFGTGVPSNKRGVSNATDEIWTRDSGNHPT